MNNSFEEVAGFSSHLFSFDFMMKRVEEKVRRWYEFWRKSKKFREEKQLGVNQLALKSGVSAAQISRFENGKRKTPHVDTAKNWQKHSQSHCLY